ncbi:MAG: hypothetical protein H6830_02950 [Planctomycetes bacterium]|nr:hypothetical protein [Planctomycetota bacterium]MCB9910099.1 hypothetical protein [Planctomycetota bacterium]MCB9913354.1 hypothetical protein [Planctomycetota bacterium]
MNSPIHLGLSTCPNDTFLAHGLWSGAVDPRGLEIVWHFDDVQALNQGLRAGRYDVSKASYALALGMGPELITLPVGSALGFGVGPVLLAPPGPRRVDSTARVLTPGADTTAHLLLRLLHPEWTQVEHRVFSEILPALADGQADLGVCIHEGRFTYQDWNLDWVEDFGARYESETQHPLPLGGLFARESLAPEVRTTLTAVLAESLEYGHRHRDATLETMAHFAQELAPDVLYQHVDLYVNDWTRDLGPVGRDAITTLWQRAKAIDWPGAARGAPRFHG